MLNKKINHLQNWGKNGADSYNWTGEVKEIIILLANGGHKYIEDIQIEHECILYYDIHLTEEGCKVYRGWAAKNGLPVIPEQTTVSYFETNEAAIAEALKHFPELN